MAGKINCSEGLQEVNEVSKRGDSAVEYEGVVLLDNIESKQYSYLCFVLRV